VSLSKWHAKYIPNTSRNDPQRLITILLQIYPKQNTLLGSPSRTMQARKYPKNCSNVTSMRTPYNSTKNTPREHKRSSKASLLLSTRCGYKNCSKITKKKLGQFGREQERMRDLGSMELP
jgi:hypothetical protein